MSSLRNAVKRVTHKERSQPRARQHLGILEKKKDYKKRAIDYHRKQDHLKNLRGKAQSRNPDEFYMSMHNSQLDFNGNHRQTEEARRKEFEHVIGPDAIKMMKEQDLNAVKLQLQKDQKRMEKLHSSLHMVGGADNDDLSGKKRKHTVFVDEEKDLHEFDAAKHFGTLPELAGRAFNRLRVEKLMQQQKKALLREGDDDYYDDESEDDRARSKRKEAKDEKEEIRQKRIIRKAAKAQARAYREMEELKERREKMKLVESHLETEKLQRGKGKKRKVKAAEDGKPAVYRWNRIRKK
mmetsp:Transcript_6901/g.10179  ORF Transcript_6901/g.10179 Transcript_6901/m.10179 type:complete len:295 (+) Transcript_6901:95-979(+)